jgi:hypothetical protein
MDARLSTSPLIKLQLAEAVAAQPLAAVVVVVAQVPEDVEELQVEQAQQCLRFQVAVRPQEPNHRQVAEEVVHPAVRPVRLPAAEVAAVALELALKVVAALAVVVALKEVVAAVVALVVAAAAAEVVRLHRR